MRLGFLGGSFDPPHCGHLAIALAAAEHVSLDRVWLAPTGRQPLKRKGAEATYPDRLAMTGLLCDADDRLLASEIDAPHQDGTPNFTVDALAALRTGHPDAELFAVIGADALPEFPLWRDSARLFELATWIVVSRPGHFSLEMIPAAQRTEQERGRLRVLRDIEVPVSSTEIRRKLHRLLDPTREEMPDAVLAYIRSHRLYSGRQESSLPLLS